MRWEASLALALIGICVTGCGRAVQTPRLSPPDAEAATIDLSGHGGQSFEAFTASPGMERYALAKLDLSADERTRISRDMAAAHASQLITGGGSQALVFTGCARAGCEAGQAVLAFGNHGETFVGVRDIGVTEQLIPDDRMEALLRLASPTGRWWDNPGDAQIAPQTTPAP